MYFHALAVGNLSVIAPISKARLLITVALAFIVLKEAVYPIRIIGIAAVIAGVVMLGVKLGSGLSIRSTSLYCGVRPALISAVGTGVAFFFVAISDRWSGWYYTSLGIRLVMTLTIALILIARRCDWRRACRQAPWPWVIAAAFFDVLGFSTFNLAVSRYDVSYVTVITSAAPVVSVLLAVGFLKEGLASHQIAGLVLIVAGVATLSA